MHRLRAANNERLLIERPHYLMPSTPTGSPESLGTGQPRFSCIPQRIQRYSLSLSWIVNAER
jgi:hypothetical protein